MNCTELDVAWLVDAGVYDRKSTARRRVSADRVHGFPMRLTGEAAEDWQKEVAAWVAHMRDTHGWHFPARGGWE